MNEKMSSKFCVDHFYNNFVDNKIKFVLILVQIDNEISTAENKWFGLGFWFSI